MIVDELKQVTLPIWEIEPERRAEARELAYELLNHLMKKRVPRKVLEECEAILRDCELIERNAKRARASSNVREFQCRASTKKPGS